MTVFEITNIARKISFSNPIKDIYISLDSPSEGLSNGVYRSAIVLEKLVFHAILVILKTVIYRAPPCICCLFVEAVDVVVW